MKPSEFLDLDQKEKAFIIAAIDIKVAHDKAEADKVKAKANRKGR